MKTKAITTIIVTLFLASTVLYVAPVASGSATKASHVILIIVDGMRYDYLEYAETPNIDSLIARGAYGKAVLSAVSETWPGHATILTGAHKNVHGIIANTYYDRIEETSKGADSRYWEDILEAETIFDVAKEYDLKTAVATSLWYLAKVPNADVAIDPRSTIDEVPDYLKHLVGDPRTITPTYPAPEEYEWELAEQYMPCDEWAMDAALLILEHERPNLLVMNFKMTDLVGHSAGPAMDPRGVYTSEVVEVVENVDLQIGRLLSKLRKLGMDQKTTIIITGDHGMSWYDTLIDPATVLPPDIEVAYWLWGSGCHIYLKYPEEDLEAAVEILTYHPAVKTVIYGTHLATYRLDHPRSGDIMVTTKDGYIFAVGYKGYGGHGSDKITDLWVPFIMAGPRVTTGTIGTVSQLDIAVTISYLLDIPAPAQSEGRALRETLVWPPGLVKSTGESAPWGAVYATIAIAAVAVCTVFKKQKL